MGILIVILIYIISAICVWKSIQILHSKGGVWEHIKPDILDFLITVIPVINTAISIIFLISIISNLPHFDFSKFFKIKK